MKGPKPEVLNQGNKDGFWKGAEIMVLHRKLQSRQSPCSLKGLLHSSYTRWPLAGTWNSLKGSRSTTVCP